MVRGLVVVAAALAAACGRISFDPQGETIDGAPGEGGTAASVQHGRTSLIGTLLDVPISAVDLTRSMLVFGATGAVSSPATGHVAGELLNPTTLRFQRFDAGPAMDIVWHVVEWQTATVQAGVAMPNVGQRVLEIPIASIDRATAFPIVSWRASGIDFSGNDVLGARFTSATTLELAVGAGTGDLPEVINWQVISIPQASVVTGELAFAMSDTTVNVTVPAAATTNAALFARWQQDDVTAGFGQTMVRAAIESSTQLSFTRGLDGDPITLSYYLWRYPGARVIHATTSVGDGSTSVTIPIAAVDLSRSFAFLGGTASTTFVGAPPNDSAGVAWFTAELTSPTTLRLTRATAAAPAIVSYYVVELP